MHLIWLLSALGLVFASLGCKSFHSEEASRIFGSVMKSAFVQVKMVQSPSGQFALGSNEDIRGRGGLGLLSPGIWFCDDFNTARARSKYDEMGANILCSNTEKNMAELIPQLNRIPHSMSKIECLKGATEYQLECSVVERIAVTSPIHGKQDFFAKVTLKGGHNPNQVLMGQKGGVEWDGWSSEPNLSPSDNVFCERYVKNDKQVMVAIDNQIDTGLGRTQITKCYGSRKERERRKIGVWVKFLV